MTELRDARLRQALQNAPDAEARPLREVADAIRAAARQALPAPAIANPIPIAADSWWQRLWQSTGSPRAPWNAAFATLLLAVLVTVMWQHEPIPDARPGLAVPAMAPDSTPVPAPEIAPKDAAPAPTPVSAPAPAPVSARDESAPVPVASVTLPGPSALGGQRQRALMAEQERSPERNQADESYAAAAQAQMQTQTQVQAPKAKAAPLTAAPAALAAVASVDTWTTLEVQMDARSALRNRSQGLRLYASLQALTERWTQLPDGAGSPPSAAPTLRLTLRSGSVVLAVLRLWDGVAQWQRPGQADVLAPLAASELQTLLLLAEQALADLPPSPR
jgi:hypothetical protein